MILKIKQLVIISSVLLPLYSYSQVFSNGTATPNITAENPFIDGSTNFDMSVDPSSSGKGLVFPRTDLTQFTFNTAALDGVLFPTAFDGMLVYNIGTGSTLPGQGLTTNVEPGFYYFYNPNSTSDITSGIWQKFSCCSISLPANVSSLDCASVSTSDVVYNGINCNITVSLPYTDGNGGALNGQTISSTGVSGLTATLQSGSIQVGNGSLIFAITGTANSTGTASFEVIIGSQICSFNIDINDPVLGLGCDISQSFTSYSTITGIPGAPSLTWINRNLGSINLASSSSDISDESAGCYFQFNRKQPYANDLTDGTSTISPAWSITQINENSNWIQQNDPCAIYLGSSWRIPTENEWTNVKNSNAWANISSAYTVPLKLHNAGCLFTSDGSLNGRGANGYFWSSTQNNNVNGIVIDFTSSSSNIDFFCKNYGFNVRCVKN